MSMSEEQLEKTGILKTMLDKADHEEETSLLERIEMFEEKVDYLNYDEQKKEKLRSLIEKIRAEEDLNVQDFLFKQLLKSVEDD